MGRLGGSVMFGLMLSAVLVIARAGWSLPKPWSLLVYPGEIFVRDMLHGLPGFSPATPVLMVFIINTLIYAMVGYLLSFLKPQRTY